MEPLIAPTSSPTTTLSLSPTSEPTQDPALCCLDTDYSTTNYFNCESGTLPAAPIASCATCVAYQCIDWDVGSAANAVREAEYFSQTNDSVYFGVASYSNSSSSGGLCFRVSSPSIDRDVIVQIVDQGFGVDSGNINIQVADGGFGQADACTVESTTMPQFLGPASLWGVGNFNSHKT